MRRLSKENRSLRQKLKALQQEAALEKDEVDSLIEELSKEIVELCAGFCSRQALARSERGASDHLLGVL